MHTGRINRYHADTVVEGNTGGHTRGVRWTVVVDRDDVGDLPTNRKDRIRIIGNRHHEIRRQLEERVFRIRVVERLFVCLRTRHRRIDIDHALDRHIHHDVVACVAIVRQRADIDRHHACRMVCSRIRQTSIKYCRGIKIHRDNHVGRAGRSGIVNVKRVRDRAPGNRQRIGAVGDGDGKVCLLADLGLVDHIVVTGNAISRSTGHA